MRSSPLSPLKKPKSNGTGSLSTGTVSTDSLSPESLILLIDQYENSIEIQKVLFQIAAIPFKEGQLELFFESVHQALSKIIYCENIIIATLDEKEERLSFVYFRDSVDTLKREQVDSLPAQRIKYTFTGYVLRTGKPLLADHNKMTELMDAGEVSQVGESCTSWLGVPLELEGKAWGVIAIQSYQDSRQYVQSDLELMSFVATHISFAINRQKLTEDMYKVNKQLTQAKTELEEQVQLRTNELVKSNYELHQLLRKQQQIQTRLTHDALHDSLTGLPNRNLFIDRLLQAMFRNVGREKLKYAVLFIDLDRFKVVNDSLGHLTGDLLLKEVAVRLEKTLRICDSIARFGGDEFCILLEGDIDHLETINITERIIKIISQPFILQGYEIFTSPSIGITMGQSYYENPDEVLRDADSAMYQAKSYGKSCYAIFDVSMHQNALRRLQLETDLRLAVKKDQLQAYFQPIVDLETRRVIGFESLARWHHPEKGFINPEYFISIAEETGLIQELGRQILTKSLQQLVIWRQDRDIYKDLTVSVNLSPRQLEDHHLVKDILALLASLDLAPVNLKLEITESILIDNFNIAKDMLNQFSDAGIKIMLDDFGTGFSSLSYLHHFPISIVKIDRSFIDNMFVEHTNMAIIKSVENLASGLNMKIVAEGIETEEQYSKLKELGVNFGQGYLLSKPMPYDKVLNYLEENNSLSRTGG